MTVCENAGEETSPLRNVRGGWHSENACYYIKDGDRDVTPTEYKKILVLPYL